MQVQVTAVDRAGNTSSATATAVEAPPSFRKAVGGLVCVVPSNVAVVAKHGVKRAVLKIRWAEVNPAPGVYNWSPIRSYLNSGNVAYKDLEFTLRIQSGGLPGNCPQWVLDMYGTVDVLLTSRSQRVNVPHWWKSGAMDAWRDMIAACGREFDKEPRIVLVSADAPMVVYSESFILGGDDESAKRLFAAGLNRATMFEAIRRCVGDTCEAFPTTLVELAVHGDIQIPTATRMTSSWLDARTLCLELLAQHGKHLALTDYGLGLEDTFEKWAPTPGETVSNTNRLYTFMYLLSQQGYAIGFQLTPRTNTSPDNYAQMATNAILLGAWWCETSGWGMLGDRTASLDAGLKANFALAA